MSEAKSDGFTETPASQSPSVFAKIEASNVCSSRANDIALINGSVYAPSNTGIIEYNAATLRPLKWHNLFQSLCVSIRQISSDSAALMSHTGEVTLLSSDRVEEPIKIPLFGRDANFLMCSRNHFMIAAMGHAPQSDLIFVSPVPIENAVAEKNIRGYYLVGSFQMVCNQTKCCH